jgi:hypothetical protein
VFTSGGVAGDGRRVTTDIGVLEALDVWLAAQNGVDENVKKTAAREAADIYDRLHAATPVS